MSNVESLCTNWMGRLSMACMIVLDDGVDRSRIFGFKMSTEDDEHM